MRPRAQKRTSYCPGIAHLASALDGTACLPFTSAQARCSFAALAQPAASGELARRFPDALLTTRLMLPVTAAATAIRDGKPARGLELLEPVRPFDHSPVAEFWPAYSRGEALLQLKRGGEAATEFRSIIDHRGELPDSPLGVARAAVLAGDRPQARDAYQAFFIWWKDADADLRPLKEARQEFAHLQL